MRYFTAPLTFLIGKPICKTCYWTRIKWVWIGELVILVALAVIWVRYCKG